MKRMINAEKLKEWLEGEWWTEENSGYVEELKAKINQLVSEEETILHTFLSDVIDEDEEKKCPDCGGCGGFKYKIDDHEIESSRFVEQECPSCNGTGTKEDPVLVVIELIESWIVSDVYLCPSEKELKEKFDNLREQRKKELGENQ